jgi:DNA damage-binding protein 1
VTFDLATGSLVVTASASLNPATPSLRQAQFFTGVTVYENIALISLWVGVLSCIELEVDKEKDTKRRRSSVAQRDLQDDSDKRLRIKETYSIK